MLVVSFPGHPVTLLSRIGVEAVGVLEPGFANRIGGAQAWLARVEVDPLSGSIQPRSLHTPLIVFVLLATSGEVHMNPLDSVKGDTYATRSSPVSESTLKRHWVASRKQSTARSMLCVERARWNGAPSALSIQEQLWIGVVELAHESSLQKMVELSSRRLAVDVCKFS